MIVSIHAMAAETFVSMLRNLANILDKAAQYAAAKGLDPTVLVTARLAPDMFSLARQVQTACDHAKGATARLSGREPPRFEDKEQTIDELKARIQRTIDYVLSVRAADFEGAEDRDIKVSLPNNLALEMKGLQFLRDWTLPHFYFHVVTAYDILRHNGVELGKRDYLAHIGSAIRRQS